MATCVDKLALSNYNANPITCLLSFYHSLFFSFPNSSLGPNSGFSYFPSKKDDALNYGALILLQNAED